MKRILILALTVSLALLQGANAADKKKKGGGQPAHVAKQAAHAKPRVQRSVNVQRNMNVRRNTNVQRNLNVQRHGNVQVKLARR